MDYKLLIASMAGVFGVLLLSGTVISMLSTYMQCSKTKFTTSIWYGGWSSLTPTIVYGLSAAFLFIRRPFSNKFESFKVPEETARIVGVGYLTMLASWVSMVSNVQNSEKTVCQADLNEMSDFKQKMLAELAQKEKAKEEHATKK
jgi:hypothetical protein